MRTRPIGPLVIVALVCSFPVPAAQAWGEKGHAIVAAIAELHLSQAAKKGVRDLLGETPMSDPAISSWADDIIHNHDRQKYLKLYPNNRVWHYVDIPFEAEQYDPERDCNGGDCVVFRIEHFRKVLADAGQEAPARADALRFLIHFVGDMHQPLHCAMRNNDHGGGKVPVSFGGVVDRERNLHKVWDNLLVEQGMRGLSLADYVRRLDAAITAQQVKAWQGGTTIQWANESHQLAKTKAYRNGAGTEALPVTGPAELDEAYLSGNARVAQEQMKKGGVRLAKVLNDAFAP